jgi:hypothetical protein
MVVSSAIGRMMVTVCANDFTVAMTAIMSRRNNILK